MGCADLHCDKNGIMDHIEKWSAAVVPRFCWAMITREMGSRHVWSWKINPCETCIRSYFNWLSYGNMESAAPVL